VAQAARIVICWRRSYSDTSASVASAHFRRNAYVLPFAPVVCAPALLVAAADLRTSIGDVAQAMLELFRGWLDVGSLESLSPTIAALRPSAAQTQVLLDSEGPSGWAEADARAHAIVQLAIAMKTTIGEALASLAPYRELGAKVPEVDGTLLSYCPDDYDSLALEMATQRSRLDAIDAFSLIRIAGRCGIPIQEMNHRLVRLHSLGVRVEPPIEDCPDGIVHWQDVIVVTCDLNGAEPVVTGRVTNEQVERAAASVRESVAETRARLSRYARMFRLRLEEPR
jgi:hypothetical protein